MEPSPAAIELIKRFEGCRLEAYPDATGIPTIGYGHTSLSCKMGDVITQEQAESYLRKDVDRIAGEVAALFTVEVPQAQFDALVSFAYNLGSGNLKTSTLLRKLKAGDVPGAAAEFPKWNRAGGQVLAGLTTRRLAEQELFLSGVPA